MAVTYTISFSDRSERSKRIVVASLAFSAEPYASGVSIDKTQLGFLSVIEDLVVIDAVNATTDMYKYDNANAKLRRYVEGASIYAETSGNQTFTVIVKASGW